MNKFSISKGFTIVELLIVVVVIAILAAITIISYNGISNRAKTTAKVSDIQSWKKQSEMYKIEKSIQCPDGYVFVYGNSSLGTSDFCVMKYEAKNSGGVAISQAGGTPWASISQTDAIMAATATGGHLLTELEWMTIAADVLSVKYNWSGGEVGSGIIYQGHINSNPSSALAASADDNDVLSGMTGATGVTLGSNSSRVLYLKSGDAIWDISGNVWEWTQQSVGVATLTMSQVGVSGDSGYTWRDWSSGSLNLGNLPIVSRPSSLTSTQELATTANWNATSKGVGRVYANYTDTSPRAFVRGGYWANTGQGGVLALALDTSSSQVSSARGFRVAR